MGDFNKILKRQFTVKLKFLKDSKVTYIHQKFSLRHTQITDFSVIVFFFSLLSEVYSGDILDHYKEFGT